TMLRRALWLSGGIFWFVYVLAPLALIFAGSFGEKWFGTLLPTGFTLRWYADLFTKTMYLRAMRMSLLVACLTVGINAMVGICSVYAVSVLGKKWLRRVFEFVILLPIAIPPVVMGLGLVQGFNWASFSLVGTWQLLLGAHLVYTLPFMLRPLMANMDMLNWNILEEAGTSLGASPFFLASRVLVPNLVPGLLSGSIMTFAMSLGEFQLAVMVTGSASQTYPVVLYQAFYVSTGFACAATTLLVLFSILSLGAVIFLGRLFGTRSAGMAV
ncbi:MAG: ABC transporter permease subunit, partial [Synergistaceae bacterium]|nr:ABC transporter permease subunit [Synergistaceae bacterium]